MLGALLLVALATSSAAPSPDPRTVVRAATRAAETSDDSVRALAARWTARRARDAGDRAAQLGLATLARLRYDYPTAERGYGALLAGAPDGYAVYAQLGLAEGLEGRGFARDAAAGFERALGAARVLGDRTAEADALLWLVFARGRLQGNRVAEAVLDSAARLVPPAAFDLRARLASRRAIIAALQGRPADASVAADSAVALARRARAGRLEGDAWRIVGQVLQYRNQFDSALVALHRSERAYVRARSRSALAGSYVWHAQVLGSKMRFGDMRDAARRALAEGEATHNPDAVGDAHRVFGVLAQMLGDWPAAAAHLKRAYDIAATIGDSSTMMTCAKYLANVAIAAGDVATSRRLAEQQLAWARRADDANLQYEMHRLLANVAAREGDTAAAVRALAAARAQLPRLPGAGYMYWLLHDDARHALARGDLATAERALDRYLAGSERGTCVVCRFDARLRLADLHARRGDVARAERELVEGTDEIDRWRAQLGDAALRTFAFQSAVSVDASAAEPGEGAARTARVLGALASAGRVDVAFALAERWRARELADGLARAAAFGAPGRTAPGGVAAGGTAAGAAVAATAMAVRNSVGAGAVRAAPRTAAEVAAALPDERTALLEFVAADGGPVTLFVVQRAGVHARVLPPPAAGALAASVGRFVSLVESGADAARLGRELGAALVDPALPLLDPRVTRLVVVPDGPLHRLPFDALRLPDGRYVLERFAVGVAPSASVLAALRGRAPEPPDAPPARLLALGDPAITAPRGAPRAGAGAVDAARFAGDDDPQVIAAAAGGLPRLAGAAREARLVGRYSPRADVRLGAAASAAFLKHADLRRYRVIHLASHAIVNDRSLAGSALVLASGGGESGFVGPGDLAALRLDADLVVLSQCRSAGGVLVTGEGVQGLIAPLLQAGARSVVATAWRIGDQSAVPVVDAFYAALARGLPVAEALRSAKQQAVRRGDPPRVWAAFLAVGDPLVTVPLRGPAPVPAWLAALRPERAP
jgi:CHAT domain-containing protein/tetratricopeptide (TPR) repeat protein